MDFWAHAHTDDPKLREEDHNPDFENDLAEMAGELPPDPGDFETVHDDILG